MTLGENIRLGFDSLVSLKLRSFLTMLGIIFGVGAVIAMTSISSGARSEMLESIKGLGVNNIIIKIRTPEDSEELNENKKINPRWLNLRDVESIRELFEDTKRVVPLRRIERTVHLPQEEKSALVGTWPELQSAFNLKQVEGRFIRETDQFHKAPVAVITTSLKRKIFPLESPLGKKIKVDRGWYTVIGVVEPSGSSFSSIGLDFPDMTDDIYVPLETLNSHCPVERGSTPLAGIVVEVNKAENVQPVAAALKRVMNRRHRGATDFEIVVPVELLKQNQKAQKIFNIVMGAIASISLLVGGIGIMNIMLSSVLERTREIGVRRAVGATRRDVVFQFLLEAVLLCIIGGIIGVILGMFMAWGINLYAGWKTIVGPGAVLLAFGVSASVGIIFGWWPAKKAAEMDVINALRYE